VRIKIVMMVAKAVAVKAAIAVEAAVKVDKVEIHNLADKAAAVVVVSKAQNRTETTMNSPGPYLHKSTVIKIPYFFSGDSREWYA
jgi:hypothetical protein